MAKVMVSLPDEFLRKVDRLAKAQNRSRSELIREALRVVLSGRPATRPSWKDALAPLRELEQQWVGRWDSTDIIRYYRDTRYGREDRR
jgi:Arc/MetJ-type ribon-helix-helix transcriptional regulator